MGKRGPKPTPTKILELRGSRLVRNRANEISPSTEGADTLKPPSWLTGRIAAAEWRLRRGELAALGMMTAADVQMLGLWCQTVQDYADCREIIAREGRVCIGANGAPYQHPVIGQMHQAIANMQKLSPRFGFTPADRVGLSAENPKAEDEFAQFVARKHAARG